MAGGAPVAGPDAETFAALESALGSAAEARGDCSAAAEEWLDALTRAARTPAAEVLLLRLAESDGFDAEPRRAAAVYERLLVSTPPLAGRVRELVSDRLARRYRAMGRFGRAEALERDMGYVNRWAVAGPFGYTRWSVHAQVFAPERGIDLAEPMASGARAVKWLAVNAPHSGRGMDVFAPLYPREGCAYALAQAQIDKAREGTVVVRCAGPFKVWWNGKLVVDADRGRELGPDEVAVPVALRKGWNHLLLKVTAAAPVVSCRLADSAGLPLKGLRWESGGLDLHEAAPRGEVRSGRRPQQVDIGSSRALRSLIERGGLAGEQEALARAGLGVIARADGRAEEALAELRRAAELMQGRPHLWYQLARAAEDSGILPPSTRRALAQEADERAAACEGGFVPADWELASRSRADRHPERAISRLKSALAGLAERGNGAPPDCPFLSLALAEVALGEEWYHEARRWAEDAERAGPRWRPVHLFWARYHAERGDPRLAAAAWREALVSDAADDTARRALARIYMNQGDWSAAISELRRSLEADPGSLDGYLELARFELEAGRHVNAENTLRAALRSFSMSPEVRRRLGEVCLRRGDREKVLAEWDKALNLRPDWHAIRRQARALRGEPDDFSLPFAVDVDAAVAASKGSDDYPRADTVMVVDQTVVRVYADGSRSAITHQARKALTTEGVEELSEIRVEGELLEARTRLPDGRTLEPAVLPGRGTLTMPGVVVGAVVEHRFRRDHARPRGGFVRLPEWYFRGIDAPHQLSDYVVIAPASMDLSVVVRNWGKRSDEEEFIAHPVSEKEGLKTWRWMSRNARPLHPASGHEHPSALLPHVLVGRARTWNDMNWEVLDMFDGRTRLTKALRDEVAKALGPTPADGPPPGPRAKARAIFRHVNGLVRADAGLFEAGHILEARAGSRVVLLAALLRAAGLDADFALARPRAEAVGPDEGPAEPVWALPEPGFFRDTLVSVALPGGERLWLDPSGPHSPFGRTAPRFQGGVAYVVSRRGGLLTTLPWGPIDEHGETTRMSLEYDAGRVTARRSSGAMRRAGGGRFLGTCSFVYAGTTGGGYRRRFAESAASWRDTWAEKRLNDRFGGARLEKVEIPEPGDPDGPFTLRARFTLDAYFDSSGPWREVPTGLEPLAMTKRFVFQTERKFPQKLSAGLVSRDEVRVRVPGARGWAPPQSHVEQTAFGSYNLTFTWEGEELTIRREVTIMPQVIGPERYGDFVRFCRGVDAAESAPLSARIP
ncbi:MAG: tetratricopeptide repeat protein [Planctomycetota bacterium]